MRKIFMVSILVVMLFGFGLSLDWPDAEDPDLDRAEEIAAQVLVEQGAELSDAELWLKIVEALRLELGEEHQLRLKFMDNTAYELWEQGSYAEAGELYEGLLRIQERILGPEHPATLTSLENLAQLLKAQGDFGGARRHAEEALEARRRSLGSDHPGTWTALNNLALILNAQGDSVAARERYEEVLEARQRLLGFDHPDTLTTSNNLAASLHAQGEFASARQRLEQVLEARRRILGVDHPDTLTTLNNLAVVLNAQGNFKGAQGHYEEVLEANRRIRGPEHPDTLTVLTNLGFALHSQGDFVGARQRYKEALEARQRLLGPEHPATLKVLANLAASLHAQGDFANARQHQEEVLEASRRLLGPEHPDTLRAMINLASTLKAQGELASAKQLYEDVLEVSQRLLGPEHRDTLTVMLNLALTLKAQRDLASAKQLNEDVLEANRRLLGPEHPDTVTALTSLAGTLVAQGDFVGARQSFEEALAVSQRLFGTEHPHTLLVMHDLAFALGKSGDAEGERRLLEQVVEKRRTHGSAKGEEAKTLFGLALSHLKAGTPQRAGEFYLATLEALEDQAATFDLSEDSKTSFRLSNQLAYRTAIGHFLDAGDVDESLHILERYRAQSLLALLRDTGDSPAEINGEVQETGKRYDAVTAKLDRLDPTANREKLAVLMAEQRSLQRRLEVLRGLRLRSGGEEAPKRQIPLRPEVIQRQLDPGTVMLAYSVGSERVDLFVMANEGPVEAYPLEVSEDDLWLQWERFLPLLVPAVADGDESASPEEGWELADSDARLELGRWLYDRLLAPVAHRLASAQRVLILPDGPLHYLPFSALVRTAPSDERGWQYLVEWKPIHVAQSATVYATLRQRRLEPANAPPSRTLVAFGDPSYPAPCDVDATNKSEAVSADERVPFAVRSAETRGLFELTCLPNTAREVTEIGKLFTDAQAEARTYLAADATEELAKVELASANYVHLAAHGLADPDVPANSFIALTIPEGLPSDRDNGILQGWEIMDTLRLDADLVVLSACDTAFGPNHGGEGLLTLSRAFQIAGARSVAASLWKVADDSTAELMIRFYRHLLSGKTKDEALRAAQMELIAGPIEYVNAEGETVTGDFTAPYHWAAFQLIGDWR